MLGIYTKFYKSYDINRKHPFHLLRRRQGRLLHMQTLPKSCLYISEMRMESLIAKMRAARSK